MEIEVPCFYQASIREIKVFVECGGCFGKITIHKDRLFQVDWGGVESNNPPGEVTIVCGFPRV